MKNRVKLLSPLCKNQYTVESTKDFISFIKTQKIPSNHQLVSFDAVLLFTNVLIDFTIDVIIKHIYENKEIQTNITKAEMKEIILLCTKDVHFTFCGKTFTQTDGVAMGSPLGSVLAGIFMVELETHLILKLKDHLLCWKRYFDDIICFLKIDSTTHILNILSNFHSSIKFTYETESDNKISFLDVQLIRKQKRIETCVYRKPTNNDVYIHWSSVVPIQ